MTFRHSKAFLAFRTIRAFSLFELLLVIAVMGIITGIAISWLSAVNSGQIRSVSLRRTAQEFCNIAEVATAAGAVVVVGNDIPATLKVLVDGVQPSTGTFRGHLFKVPNVSEELRTEVANYLEIKNGQLTYLASKNY